MREIKFRAWDGDLMYELGSLDLPWEHNDIKIMQFTGIKDKNGEEIYEGDIVRTRNMTKDVRFDGGCFVATNKYADDCLSYWNSEELEVIGNVWENPELLIDGNP